LTQNAALSDDDELQYLQICNESWENY